MDGTIAGILAAVAFGQRLQVLDEVIAYGIEVVGGVGEFCLMLGENRLSDEHDLAIVQNHLQVSPCADCLYRCILLHEDILIAVVLQCCVGMCNEVIAIVDDGVVVAGVIVLVVVTNLEQGDIAQIARSHTGYTGQIAAHLTKQYGAVGYFLELLQNASDGIDGVGGAVQMVCASIDNLIGFLFEEVGTGDKEVRGER